MCYKISCGGTLRGASVIAVSAADALRQLKEIETIGATAVAFYKGDQDVLISLFELRVFATPRPIRIRAALASQPVAFAS